MDSLKLPADLVSFLESGSRLEYDASLCEAGALSLKTLPQLKLQLFPMETSSLDTYEDDPHNPGVNSYLIEAVDLTAGCSGDYEPTGMLLWLPIERRFGVWDSSHCVVSAFGKEVTWTQIAGSPQRFINAQWVGMFEDSVTVEPLAAPWEDYEYANGQYHEPLDEY